MLNALRVAVVTIVFALPMLAFVVPMNAFAAPTKARLTALADCQRQAKAKRFSKDQTVRRRNFLKSCMIDRGFEGGIN
jgi:hypothetical protein